jgi:hypothetical protein
VTGGRTVHKDSTKLCGEESRSFPRLFYILVILEVWALLQLPSDLLASVPDFSSYCAWEQDALQLNTLRVPISDIRQDS